jgi:hypothetical protein
MTVTDGITLGIALLGAALGIINTWQALSRDRIRLKVIPKVYAPIRGGFLTMSSFDEQARADPNWRTIQDHAQTLCIEVVNRSLLPVTVSEVGFLADKVSGRMVLLRPLDVSGSKLPHRLEPLSATTIYGSDSSFVAKNISRIKKAYCKTDCGRTFYGTSMALRDLIKRRRAADGSAS